MIERKMRLKDDGIAAGTKRRFERGQLESARVRDYDDERQSISGARKYRRRWRSSRQLGLCWWF
uniref:Uncharacterized protein n=1 Tax=Hyaloperonospora arabidopsidis (strain Emoy2) TaxID=559515 RepID=M4C5L2_HYAAE